MKRASTANLRKPPRSTRSTPADRCRRRDHPDSQSAASKILVLSQVANGVWLPVVLIFILLLINRRDLMGDHVNTLTFNIIAWGSSIIMIILTIILMYVSIFNPGAAGLSGSLFSSFH